MWDFFADSRELEKKIEEIALMGDGYVGAAAGRGASVLTGNEEATA